MNLPVPIIVVLSGARRALARSGTGQQALVAR